MKFEVLSLTKMKLIFRILISALGVILAERLVPGIYVAGFGTAILVAVVLGVLNVTLGLALKILTFPLSLISFGFFLLIINGLVFWAATFVKGFYVSGFWAAFFGSLIVTLASMLGKWALSNKH